MQSAQKRKELGMFEKLKKRKKGRARLARIRVVRGCRNFQEPDHTAL